MSKPEINLYSMKNYKAKYNWLMVFHRVPLFLEVLDLHHRFPKVKWAKKKYPLFIDSVWNLVPLRHEFHMALRSFRKPPEWKVARAEEILRERPRLAEWSNNPV